MSKKKDAEIARLELIEDLRDPSWFQYGKATLGDAAADEIERLRKRVERLDDLLKIIDRPVLKDGLRSWRYDIHVARSRIIRDGEQK